MLRPVSKWQFNEQEINACDESEKAEFGKDPDEYMKRPAGAEARLKK